MKKDEEAIKLLKEAYAFILFVPNKPYVGGEYRTSYALAREMEKFFNKLNTKDDRRKK